MPRQPNILVFFTDQQRWDTCGAYGNPLGLTPNFDYYARRGTLIENAVTSQPVCGPARSCLQTGLYATQTGCFRNGIPLRTDADTVAKRLGAAGYKTGYIGKWHLGKEAGNHPGPVKPEERGGYDYWLAANALEFTSDAYETKLYDNDGREHLLPGYRVDALTDAAIRYIGANRASPFFLTVSYIEPHQQNHRDDYPAPRGYEEMYRGKWMPPDLQALGGSAARQMAGYCGMIKRLDEAFGRTMDALDSLGLLEDTVVVFVSDHGCHFKTRNAEYKRSCHDASVHTPCLFHGPGFLNRGPRSEVFSLVDVVPTLLDAAGVKPPAGLPGRSLFDRLTRGGAWENAALVQISETQVSRAVRTQRWKYCVHAPDRDPWNDAGSPRYEEQFLYDLQSDPYELVNLAGLTSHRAIADWLKGLLLGLMEKAGEARPEIIDAPAQPGGQRRVDPDEWI